jgi:internalin A
MHSSTIGSVLLLALLLVGAGCAQPAVKNATDASEVPVATDAKEAAASGNSLDLRGDGLEKLPSYVLDMTGLEALDISNNQLTGALPSEIGKLTNLKVLNASGNLMTGVPAEIGKLRELRTLNLSNNRLTGLPMELGQLSNLETLDLSGNDIAKQDLDGIRKNIPNAKIIE